jgi:hypothetical protein
MIVRSRVVAIWTDVTDRLAHIGFQNVECQHKRWIRRKSLRLNPSLSRSSAR